MPHNAHVLPAILGILGYVAGTTYPRHKSIYSGEGSYLRLGLTGSYFAQWRFLCIVSFPLGSSLRASLMEWRAFAKETAREISRQDWADERMERNWESEV
ncbi:hypothetical protein B0H16DRAFT_1599663 [Mycena metata]|uniref:Uncharacterized protein n=1 Tax=Mycena metata TaxID=1033252 RepID=A0AAD7MMI3_9AGAR|nr:hypothetical protein B0H16DRAFT_1599663 [Mycena metata]